MSSIEQGGLMTDYHREMKIQFRAGFEESASWRAAAEAEGMRLSTWLRRAANRAVEIERKQEKVREVLS